MTDRPRSRTTQVRVSHRDDGSFLVYDSRADAGHVLNAAAKAVYELADGTRTIEQIAAWLPDRAGLPAEESIVELALEELAHADLLEAPLTEPDDDGGATGSSSFIASRRELLTKLALSASAVAVLPKLISVTGLSEVAQASPRFAGSSAIAAQDCDYYYDYDSDYYADYCAPGA